MKRSGRHPIQKEVGGNHRSKSLNCSRPGIQVSSVVQVRLHRRWAGDQFLRRWVCQKSIKGFKKELQGLIIYWLSGLSYFGVWGSFLHLTDLSHSSLKDMLFIFEMTNFSSPTSPIEKRTKPRSQCCFPLLGVFPAEYRKYSASQRHQCPLTHHPILVLGTVAGTHFRVCLWEHSLKAVVGMWETWLLKGKCQLNKRKDGGRSCHC